MATYRWCEGCGDETAFEQPPCLDGHGGDCPEWLCVECGDAVLIGDPVVVSVVAEAHAA